MKPGEENRAARQAAPPARAAQAYVALGANLGDRAGTLRAAIAAIAELEGVCVARRSSFHETAPAGGPPGQPPYLNATIELDSKPGPRALLRELLAIEARFGRVRGEPNAPRTLDLDLLIYDDVRLNEPELTLPHPRMWERPFVLAPLAEIADVADLRRRFGAAS